MGTEALLFFSSLFFSSVSSVQDYECMHACVCMGCMEFVDVCMRACAWDDAWGWANVCMHACAWDD
jgi:hypothetical protein